MRRADAFALAVGRFVLSWSELEFALDLLALQTRLIARDSEAPKFQLIRKVEYIRKRLAMLSTKHQAQLGPLLAEIETLSEARHAFVHGAIFHWESDHPARLARLLQPPGPRRGEVEVTVEQIEEVTIRVRKITDQLLEMGSSGSRLSAQAND